MSTLTATPVNKTNPIVGARGIRYHAPANSEGLVTLQIEVQPGDDFSPLPAAESKAFAAGLLGTVSSAQANIATAQAEIEDTMAKAAHLEGDEQFAALNGNGPLATRYAMALVDDGTAGGIAHGAAQAYAYLVNDNDGDHDYEALGEELQDSRMFGDAVEQDKNWTGPGELTAVKRQTAVQYFRAKAEEFHQAGSASDIRPDAAAHFFGRAEAMQDAADKLSAEV